eukprot:CAMPEP_0171998246 /NCGR_PEP_ID=MMETSP1041-20130122/1133_1 /TAXON_ID=464988 /ORGANISM="Hemiselmis andersenii, Strain CCMP439" /LENGTH=105 /DNA_ID=CAMNT_0012651605 /DNA_START=400 /DNA_END=718 /DNA_ORIENTATION=+
MEVVSGSSLCGRHATPCANQTLVPICAKALTLCATHPSQSEPAEDDHALRHGASPLLFDHTPPGVFDGQGSGHDFYGTMWNPPSGFVSGMDGDRAGHFNCDYRQA